MNDIIQDETLQLNPEEIKQISEILAETLIQQSQTVLTCVSKYETIKEDQINQILNLDIISSATHGITDILGQIASWFTSLLNSISSWIVSSIQSFIQDFISKNVIPAIGGITSLLTSSIPAIGQSLANIPVFISQKINTALDYVASYLSVTIPSYLSGITSFFTRTIPSYFGTVSDFFTKTIPSYFASVSDFFTKTLPPMFTSVTDFFTKTIPPLFTSVTDFFTKKIPPLFDSITIFFTKTLPPLFDSVTSFFTKNLPPLFSSLTDFFTKTLPPLLDSVIIFFTKSLPPLFASVTDFFTKTLPPLFDSTTSFFTKTLPPLFDLVTDFFTNKLPPLFDSVISFFTEKLPPLLDYVTSFFTGKLPPLFDSVTDFFTKTLPPLFSSVTDFFTNTLPPLFDDVTGFFTKTLPPLLDSVRDFLTKTLPDDIKSIQTNLNDFIDMLQNLPNRAPEVALNVAKAVYDNLIAPIYDDIKQKILDPLSTDVKEGMANITGGFQVFSDAVTGFMNAILKYPDWFPTWFKEKISDPISSAICEIGKRIWDTLPDWLKNIWTSISDFFTKTLPDLLSSMSDGLKSIPNALDKIGETIWNSLPDWLKNVFTGINDFFTKTIPNMLSSIADGFKKFFEDPKKWFEDYMIPIFFVKVAEHEPYYSPAPQNPFKYPPLYSPTQSLRLAIPIFPDMKIFGDPFGWLMEKIINPFAGWLSEIGGKLWDGLNWLWKSVVSTFQNIAKTVWESVSGFASWLWETIVNAFENIGKTLLSGVWNILSSIGEALIKGMETMAEKLKETAKIGAGVIGKTLTSMASMIFNPIYNSFTSKFKEQVVDVAKKLEKSSEIGEDIGYVLEGMGLLLTEVIGAHYIGFGVSQALHAFATFCDELRPIPRALIEGEGGCALEPIGLGMRLRSLLGFILSLGWHIKPSYLFREMAKDVRQLSDEFTRGLMYGLTIWSTNPIVRLMNVALRDALVIELPSIDMMNEIIRRHMPIEEFDNVLNNYKTILKLYGYRTSIINWLTSKDIKIEITDRFGTKRKVPIALMYELPSASDVATMMVRDIFATIDDFQKLYSARGMHPDVGALYYLLRFRYPPPEKLWQFTVRGISGLLWATLPDTEKADIEKEIKAIGAFMPVAPISMNFQADKLLNTFKTYMKWHDYFRGAWVKDFTSDNLIYIDTLADIPTRIDQRWMTRWGIYELLSSKGVTYQSTVKEFATKILETTPTSEIQMDLTNFSRTILATGLHPDWLPSTAVAEAMNTLTEERTAIRTGFMGLFKEGFYDLTALEKMMSGFIEASFKVAYFDITQMKWTTGWVNMPVMYLPPERKLLELKALMDRSLDILKEIQRDISVAYQEFIIWDYKEYKSKLTEVINNINEFFASDYQNITGVKLPEELKLKFVEEYYKPYVEALRVWRDVFTIRRIRMWTQRWLGWIMYRVAYGVVTKEDINKLVTYIKEKAKLTDIEEEFIKQVMEIMYGIARRSTVAEYLPTPSTLSTLSEYITLDTELIKQILAERGLSEEWQKIWLTYISVKPIKSDAKALLSTYVRAFRNGVISKTTLEAYIKELPNYGFTSKEIDLITKSIDLEEQILEAKAAKTEYIPTPMMLATICEYLPEAREFYDDVVKAKRIPKEWHELWAKYIDIRPLIDDIKRYLSRAEQLYVKFMIKQDKFKEILAEASKYLGYTQKELDFLMKVTEFERYRNAWTELIGSVERLVSLSEYSPRAAKYALGKLNEMIDALPLTQEEKNELKAMWEEYIRNRPVKAEAKTYITQLINTYVDGLMDKLTFEKELQEMKKWGFSDDELTFYKAQAELRKARKLRIPIGE